MAIESRMKTPPWKHQLKELSEHADDIYRALWWQPRTGKSKTVIDNACHLYAAGKIEAVIVLAPNGVHDNWIRRQLPAHMWDGIPYQGLCWRASTAGENAPTGKAVAWGSGFSKSLNFKGLVFYTFNNESLTRLDVKKLLARIARKRTFMFVADESADYRRPGAKRTKTARAFSQYAAYRRVLDGTPVHNSPLHAFSQCELLAKGLLGYERFADFKARYADWEPAFRGRGLKVKNFKHLDELRDKLSKFSSVVLREDCDDLPAVVRRERVIPLSPAQREVYKAIKEKTAIEISGVAVSIGEQCSKLAKMQQVCGGFLFNKWGHPLPIPGVNPRLEALLDEIDLSPGKVIVWAQYKPELKLLAETLRKKKIKFVEYHGDISAIDRVRSLEAFQGDDGCKVFIGQPQAGGRGLEILATTMVWYSHTMQGLTRHQASERATKMGHVNIDMVDFISDIGPDRYIRNRVEKSISIADDLAGRGLQAILREL